MVKSWPLATLSQVWRTTTYLESHLIHPSTMGRLMFALLIAGGWVCC